MYIIPHHALEFNAAKYSWVEFTESEDVMKVTFQIDLNVWKTFLINQISLHLIPKKQRIHKKLVCPIPEGSEIGIVCK